MRLGLVSARITEASTAGWARAPATARALVQAFDLILPQDAATEARLEGLGARPGPHLNLKLMGEAPPVNGDLVYALESGIEGRKVVLAASTHPGEEPLAAQAFREATADTPAVLIVAPRHPDRGPQVAADLVARGFTVARRAAGEALAPETTAYVADTLGEMGAFYDVADAVVMGGSLVDGIGGHNPLEAARLSAAMITGPYVFNARDIYAQMFAEAAAIEAPDVAALARHLQGLLANPTIAERIGEGGPDLRRAAGRGADERHGADRTPVARVTLDTPRGWYPRGASARQGGMPVVRALLTPLSWIWEAVTARRIARTTPAEIGVPVICVGNLTMGGVGKTPVVRAIADRLKPRGKAVHLLSRGYGGRLEGPVRVDQATHVSADVGDEPAMLARGYPVWVARDRAAGARAAAEAGAEVIVMDDGHQNPSVKKALSLVVVDGETRGEDWPFGDGRVFPAGPMREPLAAGLARADAVLVLLPADLEAVDPELAAMLRGPPLLSGHLVSAAPVPTGPQVGFAGVGKPWKVERALQAAGCELADFAPFPDHMAYDEATLERLADRAAVFSAGLVTTEKDWVRLPADWQAKVTPWPVRVVFDDPAALDALLAALGL